MLDVFGRVGLFASRNSAYTDEENEARFLDEKTLDKDRLYGVNVALLRNSAWSTRDASGFPSTRSPEFAESGFRSFANTCASAAFGDTTGKRG